jgi:hypothetical protein
MIGAKLNAFTLEGSCCGPNVGTYPTYALPFTDDSPERPQDIQYRCRDSEYLPNTNQIRHIYVITNIARNVNVLRFSKWIQMATYT